MSLDTINVDDEILRRCESAGGENYLKIIPLTSSSKSSAATDVGMVCMGLVNTDDGDQDAQGL